MWQEFFLVFTQPPDEQQQVMMAFSNPDGDIVIVILNTSEENVTPKIRLNDCTTEFKLLGKSLQTMIISGPNNR